MAKFRKKPIIVEAEQWIELEDEPLSPIPPAPHTVLREHKGKWQIKTLEGWFNLSTRDWVIRGIQGEYYSCKPDIFEAAYEPVYG
jgi:hypothetical protein